MKRVGHAVFDCKIRISSQAYKYIQGDSSERRAEMAELTVHTGLKSPAMSVFAGSHLSQRQRR